MKSREELFLLSIQTFFSNSRNTLLLKEIMSHKYAKRVIEWFVCNYSKNTKKFKSIHNDYKMQLADYSKKYFDPFKRREKLKFINVFGEELDTTIGQLNFFKWFIEKGYIFYILDTNLYNVIRDDMKSTKYSTKS